MFEHVQRRQRALPSVRWSLWPWDSKHVVSDFDDRQRVCRLLPLSTLSIEQPDLRWFGGALDRLQISAR